MNPVTLFSLAPTLSYVVIPISHISLLVDFEKAFIYNNHVDLVFYGDESLPKIMT